MHESTLSATSAGAALLLRTTMYEDSEEEFDEDEVEYVYRRGEQRAAQVEIGDLVRSAPQPVVVPSINPIVGHPVKGLVDPSLPAAFNAELDQLSSNEDISISRLPNGAYISVRNSTGDIVLQLHVEVCQDYPQSSAIWHLLPPDGVKLREVRLIDPLLQEIATRLKGMPMVLEFISLMRKWLCDAALRQELEERERLAIDQSQRKAQQDLELKVQREEQERRKRELPTWLPRTAAEEDQRSPPSAMAPCRIVSDLDLPRVGYHCAARVRGRLFFYGGLYISFSLSLSC